MADMSRLPWKGIVVGVDGSLSADRALAWATAEARARLLPLHIVGVHDERAAYGASPAQTMEDARRQTAAGGPGVAVTGAVWRGSLTAALLHEAGPGELIVIAGSRSPDEADGVADAVTRHAAACVVVRSRPRQAMRAWDGAVTAGIAGSGNDDAVLDVAAEAASVRKSRLTIVHTWSLPIPVSVTGGQEAEARAREVLDRAVATWHQRLPELPIVSVTLRETAGAALLSQSEHSALLVVGARGRGGFSGLLLGSVTRGLVRNAHCPVLVVRAA